MLIRVSVLKFIPLQSLVPTTSTIPNFGTNTKVHISINAIHTIENRSTTTQTHMYSYSCWSVDLYDAVCTVRVVLYEC